MLYLTTKQKHFIIFIILFLSFYTGFRLSNFTEWEPTIVTFDTSSFESYFNNANNYTKTKLSYEVNDLEDSIIPFRNVFTMKGVDIVKYEETQNNIISILEIAEEQSDDIISYLRDLPVLKSEVTRTEDRIRIPDIDVHIKNQNTLLRRFKERLEQAHLTTREISELQDKIKNAQIEVDSLRTIPLIEEARNAHLVLATFEEEFIPHKGMVLTRYTNLIIAVIGSLVGYTVLAIIIYFCFNIFNSLMNALGVKTSRSSSRYGGGKYIYGHSDRRKTKRDKSQNGDSSKK